MNKLSRHTIIKKDGDYEVLFNTLTLGMLELNKEYSNKLKMTLHDNIEFEDLKENLLRGSFLENGIDELKLMKYIHLNSKFDTKTLGLTIAPTLTCNFKCSYCYEEGFRNNTMNDKVKEDIVKFVEGYSQTIDNLKITWYGGEPLLEIDTIRYLTNKFKEICGENEIVYEATIISNGYLLDLDMAERLKSLDVNNVQITLDGPKDIHDSRRMLLDNKGSYDKILYNLTNISDIMNVSIRINIDKINMNSADMILEELREKGLHKKVYIYVAQVDDVNNPHLSNSCTLAQEFGEYEVEFLKKAIEYDFQSLRLPPTNLSGCGAIMKNAYVIDPLGNLYKCWNTIGQKGESIGNVSGDVKNLITSNLLKWMTYNPFNDECNDCITQPLCMGGCAYHKVKSGNNKCNKYKFNLDDIISLYYTQHKHNKEAVCAK